MDRKALSDKKTTPTIRDIAAHLELSVATISRVLTRPDKVKPSTRERVLKAIKELQYHPNAMAQGLARAETRMIFFVVPLLSPFYLEVMDGVEQAAQEDGYYISLTNARGDLSRVQAFFDQVAASRADGVLLTTGKLPPDLANPLARLPPTVALMEPMHDPRIASVTIDHARAAFSAVRHLLKLGHRKIAHIASPSYNLSGRERRRGFELAMKEAGLSMPETYAFEGPFSFQTGIEAVTRFMQLTEPPTAVFADNDEMATGAIYAAHKLGVSVPGDVSVIGLDNQHFTELQEPALTTINIPRYEIGYQATKLLIRRIAGDQAVISQRLETKLILRDTTAPPLG